jgi:hypothetical protein
MGRPVAQMGKNWNTYSYWWERLLRRPRRRWVDNIRMDLEEVGWGDEEWGLDWSGSG